MRSSRLLLVLGLLVATAAAVFAFILVQDRTGGVNPEVDIATPTPTDVDVLVARRDLPVGTIISDTSDLFRTSVMPASDFEQGNFVTPGQASQVVGMKLTSPIQQNQPLSLDQVGPLGLAEQIPTGLRAFAIRVDALSAVGDLMSEGDRVDILATFPLTITYIRPGVPEEGTDTQNLEIQFKEDTAIDWSTKTLLQDIQVLRIIRPPRGAPAAGEGAPPPDQTTPQAAPATPIPGIEADPNAVASILFPGEWIVVVAMTDQQAEVVKYAYDRRAYVSLALRATGDREVVTTTGITFDILVRDFGVPVPRPLDLLRVQLQGAQETPVIPTPEPLETTTPTPTP